MSASGVDPPDRPRDQARDQADQDDDELLTPAEVAKMFRVDPKTVTRWHQAGKLSAIRTLGGHRRFHASEVRRLLGEEPPPGSS